MNSDNDSIEFKKYHQNQYNLIVHIVCFILGITAFIFLFPKNFRIPLLFMYYVLILLVNKNIKTNILILVYLFLSYSIFTTMKLNYISLLGVIILATAIPELSHMYFNEPTYLYTRLGREEGIMNTTLQLATHMINLVPYCMN